MSEPLDLYGRDAWLYDAAFDWQIDGELEFLRTQFGAARRVLEPMCGAGRLTAALAADGYRTVGLDGSAAMLARARDRFRTAGLDGEWIEADALAFEVAVPCEAAVCPIDSIAHLGPAESLAVHLEALARALVPGAPYLIQLGLRIPEAVTAGLGRPAPGSFWDFDADGRPARCEWFGLAFDGDFEDQVARITLLDDGRVLEFPHRMKVWSFEQWSAAVSRSTFHYAGAFTAADEGFTPLPLDHTLDDRRLTWHRLERR